MATIKYNGMELEEFTSNEPIFFYPQKKCVVWLNDGDMPIETEVYSYDPRFKSSFTVVGNNSWTHCALLPDPPKPRRATWLEVARWCATGNGLVYDSDRERIDTGIMFKPSNESEPIMDEIKVRKWSDTEWHEPTVDYMGLEAK